MTAATEAEIMIRAYDSKLADAYARNPFNRRVIANAFISGFSDNTGRDYAGIVCKITRIDEIERELTLMQDKR